MSLVQEAVGLHMQPTQQLAQLTQQLIRFCLRLLHTKLLHN